MLVSYYSEELLIIFLTILVVFRVSVFLQSALRKIFLYLFVFNLRSKKFNFLLPLCLTEKDYCSGVL